ncbi:MAG TPA: ComEC/Rec2 family competence protein [Fimbriimonadales bacterium]|nr:ComEC/Rec2 family competence protein [Fimbriimonadales bacterium]
MKSVNPSLPTGWKRIVGVVSNTPTHEEKLQRFVLRVRNESVLVFAPKEFLVAAGDKVSVTGELERIVEYSGFPKSSASFWKRRGVNYSMNVAYSGNFEMLSPGDGVLTLGSLWFYDTWQRLRRHLPEREAGATIGMLAGQQGLVDKSLMENMQRAGTFHMLSTSGANVLIIVGALFLLLSHLPIPRALIVAVILFILIAYMGGVGARPPVVRATLMTLVMLISSAFGKSPDGLSAWAAAGMGYAVYEPGAIWDVGFQLTFMIVLSLLLYLPHVLFFVRRVAKSFSMKGLGVVCVWLFIGVMTTLIAQITAAPLLMMNFGNVSLIAPLANLLTAPFIPFLYLGNSLAQIGAPFSESLSYGFDRLITGPFASWIASVSDVLGSFPWAAIKTASLPGSLAVVYFLGLILLSRPVIIPPSFWEEKQ